MSLINDALKKAKNSQPAAIKPAAGPALRPPLERGDGQQTEFFMGVLVAVILLLAALFIWIWSHSDLGVVKVRARSLPVEPPPVAETSAPTAESAAPTQPAKPAEAPATPAVESAAATPGAHFSADAGTPVAPESSFKLQSIFYRPTRPSATINGETVVVGARINDARVLGIDKTSVTLVLPNGQTKILDLP